MGLADIHQTLFDPHFPGVEAHAVFISGVYDNNHILIPIWSKHIVSGACFLTGALMILILLYSSRPRVIVLGSLFWGCFLIISSLSFFVKISLFVSPGLPILVNVIAFMVISFGRFAIARQTSYMWFKKCDVYDALISRRCYKEPFSHEKSMKIIFQGRGSQFDPLIVDTFFTIEDTIKKISSDFIDTIDKAPVQILDIFMGNKAKNV